MVALDELKTALKIPLSNTSRDEDIDLAERAAVAMLERATHRYFGPPKEFVEKLNGGSDALWLSEPPLYEADQEEGSEVVDPVVETLTSGTSTWTAAETETYTFDGMYLQHVTYLWPWGKRNVRVTYWAGYADPETDIPDVYAAVKALAIVLYRGSGTSAGMRSESISGYSYTMADVQTEVPSVAGVINTWKRQLI